MSFSGSDYEYEKPSFPEKSGVPYIAFGRDNKLPLRLLDLFENSGKHGTITRGKADYVIGKGFSFNRNDANTADVASADQWLSRANSWGENWNELGEKLALDMEIFNGAYVQIVFNKYTRKPTDFYHVDFHRVRSNKNNTEFYVSEEWGIKTNPQYDTLPGFNVNRKDDTQILFIKPYSPGSKTYTLPRYVGALRWVEIDIEIASFNLTSLHNDLSVSKLLNFNGDVPETKEERDEIENGLKKKYASAKNGGKWMFSWNSSAENAVTSIDLSENNLYQRFDQLGKACQQEIFTGHNVTSPMLFGIKTEGQLGGRSELREAYELLKNTYINGRQQILERHINILSNLSDIKVKLSITPTEPIGIEFSETTLLAICDKNELRERIGLEAKDVPAVTEDSNVLAAINSLSPLVANAVISSLTDTEVRKLVGIQAPPDGETSRRANEEFSDEEDDRDLEVFAEFGEVREAFISVKKKSIQFKSQAECEDETEKLYQECFAKGLTVTIENIQSEILGILSKNPGLNQTDIAKALDVDLELVNNAIDDLVKLKALTEKEGSSGDITYKPTAKGAGIIKNTDPGSLEVYVRYSYYGPKDNKNRPFCAKLLDLNRVYSRKDIETISQRLGYSVWERRGGFYTNPKTGITTPYCRHAWLQEVMIKKIK